MADKADPTRAKKPRKRPEIKFYVTAEQKAQINREVPEGEVGQYCRDRIFHPAGLRDPLIDVGARLLAMAAQAKGVSKTLGSLGKRLDDDLARAQGCGDEDPERALLGLLARVRYDELVPLLEDAIATNKALLEEARQVRGAIARRQEQTAPIPRIEQRRRDR